MAIPERRLATKMRRITTTLTGTLVARITVTARPLPPLDDGKGEGARGLEVESGVELMEPSLGEKVERDDEVPPDKK